MGFDDGSMRVDSGSAGDDREVWVLTAHKFTAEVWELTIEV